jgi:hypothetical protein
MGQIRARPPLVLPIFAAFAQSDALLDLLPQLLADHFGPVDLVSFRFEFFETDYYAASMGERLRKQFFTLCELRAADFLPDFKNRSNQIETLVCENHAGPSARPLNLDPGYLDFGKLVLATTKDHAHRIYLGRGIFGEVTLAFRDQAWHPWPWTYPDYKREDVRQFFKMARERYREILALQNTLQQVE